MNAISVGSFILRTVGTLVAAVAGWAFLGYLATAPLGAIYGWSGHPSIPAAPVAVYIGLYIVVLPVFCLVAAWRLVRWVETRIRGGWKALSE